MARTLTLVTVLAALAGCSKKKSEGLKPADDWNAEQAEMVPPGVGPAASPHNPHVAVGGGDPSDPHAGVDMGGAAGGADPSNPHAGVDMTAAMPPPDPNRPIDPTHRVKGVIKIDPKAKDKVKPGTAVFVYAELPGPDGNPISPPLAVEKLTWGTGDLPFELSEANAMVAGTQLTGDVFVVAHYDNDGDAKSKTSGDVLGQVKVKIPADAVTLMLDKVIP